LGDLRGSLAWQCGAGGGDSDFELSTQGAARFASQVSRAGNFQYSASGLLLRGWKPVGVTGSEQRCKTDHQPYRQALIPGYEEVLQLAAGAYGMVISGAGPTWL